MNFSFYFIGKINALSGFAEKLVFLPSYSTCIVYISIYKWRCLPFVCEELYATGFCRFLSLFRLGPFYCKNSSTGSTQFDDNIILYVNALRCLCYFTSSKCGKWILYCSEVFLVLLFAKSYLKNWMIRFWIFKFRANKLLVFP